MAQDGSTSPGRARLGHDVRREQILACARALFAERNYETVSSAEIARAAGVSRALVNHYFGSKRELHLEVLREMMDVPPVPVPEYVAGETWEERVTASVDGWLELLSRNPETWLAATAFGTSGKDEDVEKIIDEYRDRAVDRIVEVAGLGPTVRLSPEIHGILRGFSGMAEATTREWLRHGRLTRRQVHILLEGTLIRIIRELVPQVCAAGEEGTENGRQT